MHIGYWSESQRDRDHYEDQDIGAWTILKLILKRPMEGSCEHDDEPSGSIKCWEVLEELHNWQLLEKGSAP
jgi:hypothetical protein